MPHRARHAPVTSLPIVAAKSGGSLKMDDVSGLQQINESLWFEKPKVLHWLLVGKEGKSITPASQIQKY